jgi:histidine triad (HIT) family protein
MRRMGHDCTLCHVSENPDHKVIFGDDTVLFLQNEKEQGALLGSGVIIPVGHAETVFDLTPEEACATFALLQHVKAWMDEYYHPDGYNVGWNCGAVGGQLAMHVHLHVIPPVSAGTLCGTWHPVLVKTTGQSVVVRRMSP